MGQTHHVELDLEQLSSSDLYWQKDKLAKREAYLRAAWHEFESTARLNRYPRAAVGMR